MLSKATSIELTLFQVDDDIQIDQWTPFRNFEIEIPILKEKQTVNFFEVDWEVHLYDMHTLYLFHERKNYLYRFKMISNSENNGYAEFGRKRSTTYYYDMICSYGISITERMQENDPNYRGHKFFKKQTDIDSILQGLDLSEYSSKFKQEKIFNINDFLQLGADDLKELQMKIGEICSVLRYIHDYVNK
jgi:hypothetical protein